MGVVAEILKSRYVPLSIPCLQDSFLPVNRIVQHSTDLTV